MRRAEGGVTGESKLPTRSKDPQLVVGVRVFGRQHESRLREVRPAGDALHRFVVQPGRVKNDRDRVTHIWRRREHVDLSKII